MRTGSAITSAIGPECRRLEIEADLADDCGRRAPALASPDPSRLFSEPILRPFSGCQAILLSSRNSRVDAINPHQRRSIRMRQMKLAIAEIDKLAA